MVARRKAGGASRAATVRMPPSGDPRAHARPPPMGPSEDRPALRLAMSRGGLGLELDDAFDIGPMSLVSLSIALPNIRFPVDLSGGVARFRHRRGALLGLSLETSTASLATWAGPRLKGILSEASPSLSILPAEGGVRVGLCAGDSALAFDVVVAPVDGDLRFIAERARGVGVTAPPHLLAMRALAGVLSPFCRREGGTFWIAKAASQLTRHVLAAAGGRAPSVGGLRWVAPAAWDPGASVLSLSCASGEDPTHLGAAALRAIELAEVARAADSAAFLGDLDGARLLYLEALERAPRHPELSERVAWIDAMDGQRAEAGLSLLVEATPAAFAGVLGGKLLSAVGDAGGARAAYARAAETEPYGPLSALTWLLAAEAAPGSEERLSFLNRAVSRAPSHPSPHTRRLAALLDASDPRGAKADVEHLEALARGPHEKLGICRSAAQAFLRRGFATEAYDLFERALRYAPHDELAVLGLGRSLKAVGRLGRAMDVFARAASLAARNGRSLHEADLEIGRGLVEVALDRPAAIARVRAIPERVPASIEARFLEGLWRHELGDITGSAAAFGRLRQEVDEASNGLDASERERVATMLVEAAGIEETVRGDVFAAERSLGLALRLSPRDPSVREQFRRVAAVVAKAMPIAEADQGRPTAPVATVAQGSLAAPRGAQGAEPEAPKPPLQSPSVDEDEARVEGLTNRLRGNPEDHATAMDLAAVLDRLGRDLELIALLSARLEEGGPEIREEVEPLRRRALLRLAARHRQEGQAAEAELYEMMALSSGAE